MVGSDQLDFPCRSRRIVRTAWPCPQGAWTSSGAGARDDELAIVESRGRWGPANGGARSVVDVRPSVQMSRVDRLAGQARVASSVQAPRADRVEGLARAPVVEPGLGSAGEVSAYATW